MLEDAGILKREALPLPHTSYASVDSCERQQSQNWPPSSDCVGTSDTPSTTRKIVSNMLLWKPPLQLPALFSQSRRFSLDHVDDIEFLNITSPDAMVREYAFDVIRGTYVALGFRTFRMPARSPAHFWRSCLVCARVRGVFDTKCTVFILDRSCKCLQVLALTAAACCCMSGELGCHRKL